MEEVGQVVDAAKQNIVPLERHTRQEAPVWQTLTVAVAGGLFPTITALSVNNLSGDAFALDSLVPILVNDL
jgi:hypothetical protein